MTRKHENQMTDGEVLGDRTWPAWFTVDQMRRQLAHEDAGAAPTIVHAETAYGRITPLSFAIKCF